MSEIRGHSTEVLEGTRFKGAYGVASVVDGTYKVSTVRCLKGQTTPSMVVDLDGQEKGSMILSLGEIKAHAKEGLGAWKKAFAKQSNGTWILAKGVSFIVAEGRVTGLSLKTTTSTTTKKKTTTKPKADKAA